MNKSWVNIDDKSDFSIHNIPFGVFKTANGAIRCGSALGDNVIDLDYLQKNNLLDKPGKGADDKVKGGHPDVVVSNDRAFLFYFTHPGRLKSTPKSNLYEQRRSSIQVVELEYKDGQLSCDRDKPTFIFLQK